MRIRSHLYVPGDRPEVLAKALGRGADALIVDLEDAVPWSGKDAALATVHDWLSVLPQHPEAEVWVRINVGGRGLDDVAALAAQTTVTGFCLAKTENVDHVRAVASVLDDAGSAAVLAPLLESASAVLRAAEIAAGPRVRRLQVGEADLCADAGIDPGVDDRELLFVRSSVVLASVAAGIDPPVGAVTTDFTDLDRLRASTEALRRLGYFGRACIHPAQLPVVNDVFTPTEEQLARARRILAVYEAALSNGSGVAIADDGRMIDEAVVRQARRLLG